MCGLLTSYIYICVFPHLFLVFCNVYLAALGLSRCTREPLQCVDSGCAAQVQSLWLAGPQVPRPGGQHGELLHGSSDLSIPIRNWTHVPCIAKQILNHWTTRKVPVPSMLSDDFFLLLDSSCHFVNLVSPALQRWLCDDSLWGLAQLCVRIISELKICFPVFFLSPSSLETWTVLETLVDADLMAGSRDWSGSCHICFRSHVSVKCRNNPRTVELTSKNLWMPGNLDL